MNPYQQSVSQVGYSSRSQAVDARARFIVRTYNHLFGAMVLFTLMEVAMFTSGLADSIAKSMLGGRGVLLIFGGFMLVSWLASRTAYTARSLAAQYAALAGFVAAEAIIFVPILYIAEMYAPSTIRSAAAVSLVGFAALTGVVFATRKDFSFLGTFLWWGGIVAVLLIVAAMIFGFQLGTFFSVAMIGFAGAAILYDTSNVLRAFPEDRYVAASLQLFASVALLFMYVLRLFLSLSQRD